MPAVVRNVKWHAAAGRGESIEELSVCYEHQACWRATFGRWRTGRSLLPARRSLCARNRAGRRGRLDVAGRVDRGPARRIMAAQPDFAIVRHRRAHRKRAPGLAGGDGRPESLVGERRHRQGCRLGDFRRGLHPAIGPARTAGQQLPAGGKVKFADARGAVLVGADGSRVRIDIFKGDGSGTSRSTAIA